MIGTQFARVGMLAAVILGLSMAAMPVQADSLSWTGCGITKKAFMAEMAAAFEARAGVPVALSGGGATKGIRAVGAGNSALGGSCRPWLRGIDNEVVAAERDVELVQVAWDALVVITHPSNPVESISMDQLRSVYQGEITRWNQLGGPDKPIALVVRESKSSGVGHMFRRLAFNDPELEFKARSLKVKSTGPLEKRVQKLAGAMAIDGISSARRIEVKILSVDGVAPTKSNIANGSYPMIRPLYLAIHKTQATPMARQFIEFALSAEGQSIISAQGTVNLAEGQGLAAMLKARDQLVVR